MIIIITIFAGSAHATEASDYFERIARYQKWNNCEPMALFVGSIAKIPGLSKEKIETVMRDRLRAAQLYGGKKFGSNSTLNSDISLFIEGEEHPHIAKKIGTDRFATYDFVLHYSKRVQDLWSGFHGRAPTWNVAYAGISIGSADYIISKIVDITDDFIKSYLHINANACQN